MLLLQGLHLSDVALDFPSFRRRDVLGLPQVVTESVDGLVGLLQVLIAASDVAQIGRVNLVRVELRVEVEAHRGDVPGLVRPEQVAGAADLQVVRGDGEAGAAQH